MALRARRDADGVPCRRPIHRRGAREGRPRPKSLADNTTKKRSYRVMNQILETKRLTLREMTIADLDFISSMLAHPEVMEYYPKCYSRVEAEAWIQRQIGRYRSHGHGLWLASEKEANEPVGQV